MSSCLCLLQVSSHHAVLRPRMPPPGVEFLVLQIDRLVDGLWIERGVDLLQNGNDIGVAEGLPSLSKCLAKRPSLRAKSMKLTSSLVFGFTYQSSLTAGLPWSDMRSLMVLPLRGSKISKGNARLSTASRACSPAMLSA